MPYRATIENMQFQEKKALDKNYHDNKLTTEDQVLECFADADVLKKFKSLEEQEQEKIIDTIMSEADENGQKKRIRAYIKKLS